MRRPQTPSCGDLINIEIDSTLLQFIGFLQELTVNQLTCCAIPEPLIAQSFRSRSVDTPASYGIVLDGDASPKISGAFTNIGNPARDCVIPNHSLTIFSFLTPDLLVKALPPLTNIQAVDAAKDLAPL